MRCRRSVLAALLSPLVAGACGSPTPPAEPVPEVGAAAKASPAEPAGPGRVETHAFHSDALGVDKDYVVYLPGGYDADPARRWPVIYLLHGLGGDETNWTEHGDLAGAADRLALPAIVVMPDGDAHFYVNSATPVDFEACSKHGAGMFDPSADRARTCVQTAAYEDYIVEDLVAHVEETYRALPERGARGIAGLSMGGYGALTLAMRHRDVYAAAASHSGVDSLLYKGPHPYVEGKVEELADVTQWGRGMEPFGTWIRNIYGADAANWKAHDPVTMARALAPGDLALYLDCGTEDEFQLHDGMQYLHEVLNARGVEHTYYLGPGRHDMAFWRDRIDDSLAFFAAVFAAGA